MTITMFGCIVSLVFIASVVPDPDPNSVPVPSCGFCAAFSYLHCSGSSTSIDALKEAFSEQKVSGDLSLAEIQAALGKVGMATNAVRFAPVSARKLPTPCILYIEPGRWPQRNREDTGHFVTVVKHLGSEVVILDWAGMTPYPAIHMKHADLEQYWGGVALIPKRSWSGSVLAGLCLLSAIGIWKWCRSRIFKSSAVLLLGIAFIGCTDRATSKLPPTPNPTLIFAEPLGNLGIVASGSLKSHEFEFRVWNDSPVTIVNVEASCGCTTPDQTLIGRELAAGSTHRLQLSVRPDGYGSNQTKSLRVVTSPPSTTPLVLAVSYRHRDPPQLSVNRFTVKTTPETLAVGEIVATFQRPVDEPALTIKPEDSLFGDFVLEDVNVVSETTLVNARLGKTVMTDSMSLRFRAAKLWTYGHHSSEMALHFSDGSVRRLPAQIIVPHPINVSSESVFAGVLTAGTKVEKVIRVSCPEAHAPMQVSFTQGIVVAAKIEEGQLKVQVRAADEPGRHETKLTITAASLPPMVVPVTCITRKRP